MRGAGGRRGEECEGGRDGAGRRRGAAVVACGVRRGVEAAGRAGGDADVWARRGGALVGDGVVQGGGEGGGGDGGGVSDVGV